MNPAPAIGRSYMSQSRSEQSLCSVLSIERPTAAHIRSADHPSGSSGSSGSTCSDEGDASDSEDDAEDDDDDDSEGDDAASRLKHFLCNFCCCICAAGVASCSCSCCRSKQNVEAGCVRTSCAKDQQPEQGGEQEQDEPQRQTRLKCPSFTATTTTTSRCNCSLTQIIERLVRARQYVRDSLEFAEYGKTSFTNLLLH